MPAAFAGCSMPKKGSTEVSADGDVARLVQAARARIDRAAAAVAAQAGARGTAADDLARDSHGHSDGVVGRQPSLQGSELYRAAAGAGVARDRQRPRPPAVGCRRLLVS